jgi:alpha-2-macroglobulin
LKTDDGGRASFEFAAPDSLTTYRVVVVGETKASQFGGDASTTLKISKPLLVEASLPRFLRDGDEVELRAVVRQSIADSDDVHVQCVTDANCKLTGSAESTQTARRDVPAIFRFRAKVTDKGLLATKIRFDANSQANPKMADSVELTLPVESPTIWRTESIAGSFTGPKFDVQSTMPEPWKNGHGKLDVTVSTSTWLPEISGLPVILDYPHGCFEQISARLLGYALLGNLLAYLPDAAARDAEYRTIIERGMQQFDGSLLENGMLPYWPGGTSGHAFVTAQAFWAVNEASGAGFAVPERLRQQLSRALTKIVQGRVPVSGFDRAFALFVLSQRAMTEDFTASAEDMYLRRDETDDEGRALLAMALNQLKIMEKEQEQLLREIDAPVKERAFNAMTLTSTTRAEAICALALRAIAPKIWTPQKQKRVHDRLFALMSSSGSLSTQENLWLLLAFKSMLGAENAEPLKVSDVKCLVSRNGCSASWIDCSLNDIPQVEGLNEGELTYLMKAVYATDAVETDRLDRGFRVERVVRDLTDPTRPGNADIPFKLGDQILITYRLYTRKLQNYVALEDALPAGLETVNPDLAMIGKFFEIPPENAGDRVLSLSHSELRDRSTRLYFDTVDPGSGTYSVLARATAAGTFRWPATQVVPMYDSRFSGLSPSSVCVVSGE